VQYVFIVVLAVVQLSGLYCTALGALRQAFATIAKETGSFSHAFDEKAFDVTGLSWWQKWLVGIGGTTGFPPGERAPSI
jgi:hypothetical protein